MGRTSARSTAICDRLTLSLSTPALCTCRPLCGPVRPVWAVLLSPCPSVHRGRGCCPWAVSACPVLPWAAVLGTTSTTGHGSKLPPLSIRPGARRSCFCFCRLHSGGRQKCCNYNKFMYGRVIKNSYTCLSIHRNFLYLQGVSACLFLCRFTELCKMYRNTIAMCAMCCCGRV